MKIEGNIRKMAISVKKNLAYYSFIIGKNKIELNEVVGRKINFVYLNKINCIKCGVETKKSFAQGFCYSCFISAPETENCVLRPELCRAHEGIARDLKFAKNNCLIDQYVYLANTSGIKVGVTRNTQIPARWLDQGASQAIILARTPNRYLAGLIEVELKNTLPDKTNWKKLLTFDYDHDIDLKKYKTEIASYISDNFKKYIYPVYDLFQVKYPVLEYPEKISSLNFDKQNEISGILKGIKGQYLIFNDGKVLNIRKFGGYLISVEF